MYYDMNQFEYYEINYFEYDKINFNIIKLISIL